MMLAESTCHPGLASFDSLHGFSGGMYFMSSNDRNPWWILGVETGLRASQGDPKQGLSNVQDKISWREVSWSSLQVSTLVFLFSVLCSVGLNNHFSFSSWSLLFLLFLLILPTTSVLWVWVLSGWACRMVPSLAAANSFKNWLDLQRVSYMFHQLVILCIFSRL